MATQFEAQLAAFDKQANDYIDQLLDQARGDRDLAIQILTRDHNVALGSNDAQTAAFLEKVSDDLESRIGRIPYDYEIATTRTQEDLARTEDVATRNRDLALARLAEDEKVWREQFTQEADDARQGQGEALAKRGLLTGTRAGAEGLASREVGRLEGDIGSTLSAYERALGRQQSDINRQTEDILFDARRGAERTQADLTTQARRGVIDTQDRFKFGSEAERRRFEAREKELERQRTIGKLGSLSMAQTGVF